jgi:Aldehyde oxidase and xanthine dehydrogenase, a/b hammerhead domain/[2Fe-2S] binding domain
MSDVLDDLLIVTSAQHLISLKTAVLGVQQQPPRHLDHVTLGTHRSGSFALLSENPQPTPEDVRRALSGNLCRCGNYPNAITAVLLAAELEVSRWTNLPASPAPVYAPRTLPAHVFKSETGKPVCLLDSSRPALDAYAKVPGRARFTGDLGFHADDEVRETLVAKVIRSPYPHAEVLRIDDSQAWHLAGFRGMVTWADVPSYRNDRRFLNRHARYVGDTVTAITADDQYPAQEALG